MRICSDIFCLGERCSLTKIQIDPSAEEEQGAELQMQLSHPKIVQLHSYFMAGDELNIAMELCVGGDLDEALRGARRLECSVEDEMRNVIVQVFSAAAFVHAHCIVHRDIKPANVMIASGFDFDIRLDEIEVKLSDFGFACACPMGARIYDFAGTPKFAAA